MFMVSLSFFIRVVQLTEKFCYKYWAIEKCGQDKEYNDKKRRHFIDVPAKQGWHTTPGYLHHANNEKKKYTIRAGFII